MDKRADWKIIELRTVCQNKLTRYKMASKTILWKTISYKFKEFCKHCTLHGVYYFYDNTRWWVHAVWMMILTSSLILCCYLSHMIWDKFVIDPTLTVVESTHYSTADIPFPAVAVCDTDVVFGPKTDNISHLLSLRGYNRTQISEFFRSFTDLKLNDYSPKPYIKKMHFILDDLGYPLLKLLLMFKKPCEEVITECSWRSNPQNCSQMFRPVYTIVGYCCQFDITYFRDHVDQAMNFVSGMQLTEALDIVVDGQKVTSEGKSSSGYISLYVFDEQEKISFINNAIMLTPAAFFDVNVYLWAIDSSSYVKALAMDKRQCILDSDPGPRSYQACLSRHLMRRVVDQCKCLPFDFTAEDLDVEDLATCTWDSLLCTYQNLEKVQADMRIIMAQKECYQKCDYVQYETEVEFIKNRQVFKGASSRSRVVVHYSATTCMKYRREVLYTWDQMLANLGGIFGLCLGGSLISVIEIIWFILDLIVTVIKDIIEQRKMESQARKKKAGLKKWNANKIFALSQDHSIKAAEKFSTVKFKFTN